MFLYVSLESRFVLNSVSCPISSIITNFFSYQFQWYFHVQSPSKLIQSARDAYNLFSSKKTAKRICWRRQPNRSAEEDSWTNLLKKTAERICWRRQLNGSAEEDSQTDLLKKTAERICWRRQLNGSAEEDSFTWSEYTIKPQIPISFVHL